MDDNEADLSYVEDEDAVQIFFEKDEIKVTKNVQVQD